MKVFDTWLNKEFEKALKDTKGYTRQQKINKVFIGVGLLVVTIITLNILNIF